MQRHGDAEMGVVMSRVLNKNSWTCLILILCGVVLGGFLGTLASGVSWLSWLDYGKEFGIGGGGGSNVVVLNLGILVLSFGLQIKINIASIIGIIIAIIIYAAL